MEAIRIDGLHKEFTRRRGLHRQRHVAVRDLSLSVPAGGVFGFLGPNGSGKTTTIRCLLGLMAPTSGTAYVLGQEVGAGLHTVIDRIGALVEAPALFPTMTGRRNLELLARSVGIGPRAVDAKLEQVGLAERADDDVSYWLGMRQRLAIATALLKDPELVLLDEPANGLDPAGIKEIRRLLRELGDEGRTVFVSSHHLAEIEHMCDAVAIIANGRCVTSGPVHEILHAKKPSKVLVKLPDAHAGREALASVGVISRLDDDGLLVDIDPTGAAWVNRVLVDAGLWLTELRPIEASLEDVFLALTGTEA